MTESNSKSREEIAREIKEIFSYVKSSNRDENVLANACRRLRNKSEAGYRGLVRLLNKYGYTNVILDITNAIQSDTEGSERLSSISDFGQEPILIHPQQQPSPHLHLSNSTTNNTTKFVNSSKQIPGSFVPTNSDGRMQIRPPSVSEQEHSKSQRYARTKYFLSKTGLLGIADTTKELLKKNKQLQKDLDGFKQQTEAFVESVLLNPQNAGLLPMNSNQNSMNSFEVVLQSTTGNSPPINSGLATPILTSAAAAETSDFANILSGIYDFEVPNMILAPLSVDQMFTTHEHSLDTGSVTLTNDITAGKSVASMLRSAPSSPPRKRMKRHTD